MKVFKEITEWATPNHTYFLSDDKSKMYAYIKQSGVAVESFRKPYRFDSKGRRFVEVANSWGYAPKVEPAEEEPVGRQYRVAGSKNNTYTVTNDRGAWSCTCPASKWQKGECKHIKELKTKS